MTSKSHNRKHRGITMVEALVAGLVLATCVVGLVQFMYVNYQLTAKAEDISAGYSIGRSAVETVRELGFTNAAEGGTTTYFDQYATFPPKSTTKVGSSIYSCVTTVTSDTFNGANPATTALRTVTITVTESRPA